LPLFGNAEQRWPPALRGILYGLGLAWCFMGVAIIADVFMGGIERITSKKVRKFNNKTNRYTTTPVWNATVANLTLMALGSSAPEILLSIIELFQNKFFSGELGPSCIVGSAAFNLLVISGVCIVAIPAGEVRRIKEIRVYMVTAFFSVFAYLWLLIILLASSKNAVTPLEGIVTFLFFPLNVLCAYLADIGMCTPSSQKARDQQFVLSPNMTPAEMCELDVQIRKRYGAHLTPEQVSSICRLGGVKNQTRAQRRIAATRMMVGGKRVTQPEGIDGALKQIDTIDEKTGQLVREEMLHGVLPRAQSLTKVMPATPTADDVQGAVVEFAKAGYAVMENAGSVKICVRRTGSPEATVGVSYATIAGEGRSACSSFKSMSGTLVFKPQEYEKEIEIEIHDDSKQEDAESFRVDLRELVTDIASEPISLGSIRSTLVFIFDDDAPGVIGFPHDTITVQDDVVDRVVTFDVVRKQGCVGRITCTYLTEDNVAIAGRDYDAATGTLVFEDGVLSAKIRVNIKANAHYEKTEDFRLVLDSVDGGARFDPTMDGGSSCKVLTVYIQGRPHARSAASSIIDKFSAINWDQASVGHANWKEQWTDALFVNGGQDASDEPPSVKDWLMHIITLPWKLLFALVPPSDYCGGWLCFVCALGMIGFVTAIIGDIAALFGCVIGLPNQVTAITLVALGTSLPDTFASKTAATQDPFADASLGNITGSNSVNVFLGIGLPWMMGSIYWAANGPNDEYTRRYKTDLEIPGEFRKSDSAAFIVKAGSLGFSVAVFVSCASACLILLAVRRFTCGGELGGGTISKYASAVILVGLWLLYICLSVWKTFSEMD